MPHKSGVEAYQEIAAIDPSLEVIFTEWLCGRFRNFGNSFGGRSTVPAKTLQSPTVSQMIRRTLDQQITMAEDCR